ncbi:MAG: hypothetical protein M0R70_15040 [Nitrospirae bacterium]|nr:hypothetical protein [Nitrospirota bacterium]
MRKQSLILFSIFLLVPRIAVAYDILSPGVSMVIAGILSLIGAIVAARIVWKKPNPSDSNFIKIVFTITAFIVTLILMFSAIVGFLSKLA